MVEFQVAFSTFPYTGYVSSPSALPFKCLFFITLNRFCLGGLCLVGEQEQILTVFFSILERVSYLDLLVVPYLVCHSAFFCHYYCVLYTITLSLLLCLYSAPKDRH
jgi:hypothetical protein